MSVGVREEPRQTRVDEPVDGLEQLTVLRGRVSKDRRTTILIIRLALVVCAAVVIVNLATTGLRGGLAPVERAWSLFPILAAFLLLAPAATGLLWVRPRLLRAQGRQLAERDLLGRTSRIGALEHRLSQRLETLSPPRSELVATLSQRSDITQRKDSAVESIEDEPSERDLVEQQWRFAMLDAYAIALGNFELDMQLQPDFFDSPRAANTLNQALSLLRPEHEHSPQPSGEIPAASRRRPSIAVLPFTDLSRQGDQQYFCDGIAEELINALTSLKELRVVGRSSAFSFRGKNMDSREIGSRLDATSVLEGSVRKAGSRVRITAQLVNVEDGDLLWSESFDREMHDLFAIQDEIARRIVGELKLGVGHAGLLVPRHTDNLEAYNLYLKGRFHWNRRTEEGLEKSLEYFERAVGVDPDYAMVHAGIADCYTQLGDYGYLPPEQARSSAKAAAKRALALDDSVAEARASLAYLTLLYDWDWPAAEREFERAIELKPSYATAHQFYAEYLTAMGRMDQAIEQIRRAQELDPLSLIVNTVVAWVYYRARQFNQAIEQCQKTLDLDPSFALAHHLHGWALGQESRYQEAVAEAQRAVELSGDSTLMTASLGFAYAASGENAKARALLEELEARSRSDYVPPYDLALLHTGLGSKDEALEWLEKAYQERYGWLVYLNADSIWDSLRSEPRFRSLVKKIGLPKPS